MRTLLPLFLAVILGCDAADPAGPPLLQCDVWATCPGALSIHTEIITGAFGRQRWDMYVPGDSILARFRIRNHANIRSDSLEIYYEGNGLAPWTGIGDPVALEFGNVFRLVVLEPGETREIFDTIVVGGHTFGRPSRLNFWVSRWLTGRYVEAAISGTQDFLVVPSGYTFDIVSGPPGAREAVEVEGRRYNATRIRHKSETGVLVRISNPYSVPLEPIGIGHCFWDGDHGYVCASSPADMPRLESGQDVYVEYPFTLDTEGRYHDWWGRTFTQVQVCPEGITSSRLCGSRENLLVTANFEADCAVSDVPIGVAVRDETPECGRSKDGSAYRFSAQKGERYRVSLLSTAGEVFLSPADGVHYSAPRITELLIPADGVYYVVLLHRDAPGRFRLDKLN